MLAEIEAVVGNALRDLLIQLGIDRDEYPWDDGHHHPSYAAALSRAAAEAVLPILDEAQAQMLAHFVTDGVCLSCGDGVLSTGEHIDPERHTAYAYTAEDVEFARDEGRAEGEEYGAKQALLRAKAGLKQAMLGTTDGGHIAVRVDEVVGEMVRLAAEHLDACSHGC